MDRPTNIAANVDSSASPAIGATGAIPPGRYLVFASIAVIGGAADLATKAWCFASPQLRAGDVFWLWPGHIGIQLSRNLGALFGIGQGKVGYFAALSIVAAIAIPVWLFWFRAARDATLTTGLGCVMAGVLGNLYDRLGLSGDKWVGPDLASPQGLHAVRDWILWQANDSLRWPNFNIADSLLVIGVSILMLHAVFHAPLVPTKQSS